VNTQTSYPLSWPASWPRTPFRRTSNFGDHSIDRAVSEVYHQLKLLGVGDYNVVVSSNLQLRKDGLPISGQRQPSDTGVAIYFKLKGRPCVLACDKWAHAEDNLWAIAKDIEAQRGRIRWGVGSVEQAFAGYTALPAPGTSGAATWYQVLGVDEGVGFEVAADAYRKKAMACHPDRPGGSNDAMVNLNASWDQARRHFGK
jgi:hypothetical protein